MPLAVEHWNKMETSPGSIRDTCNSCRLLPPSPVLYWMLMLHPGQTLWLFSSLSPLANKGLLTVLFPSVLLSTLTPRVVPPLSAFAAHSHSYF